MSMAYRITGTLRCAPEDIGTVLAHLPEHIRLSRAEPGCCAFEVAQDEGDPCLFHLDETYEDAAAFEAHKARTRASAWWEATAHVPRDIRLP